MAKKVFDQHGLTKARQTKIDALKPRIDELLSAGMNGYKIALEVDVPRSTIYDYIKEIKAEA